MNRTVTRTITSLITFCLFLSTFPVSAVRAQREYRVTPPALARTAATPLALTSTSAFAAFPMDESVTVDLAIDEDSVKCLWGREVTEQIRDWLLFTVVSSSDLSPSDVNQVFYDLPASRCGYLEGVANFEYGNTRSRFIGNGQIVALVPPGDGNARIDQLGRIADEHRKNLGELPSAITVFEYNIDQSSQTARLTKQGVVNAQQLFSEPYGYFSSTVNNLADLERFMKQIDDLTYASFEGPSLVLGGRKIKNRTYQGIRVEDVAAIWKSEDAIKSNETGAGGIQKEFYEAWGTVDDMIDDLEAANISGLSENLAKLKKMRDVALIRRQATAQVAGQTPVPSPAIGAYEGWKRVQLAILNRNLTEVENEANQLRKIRDNQKAAIEALLSKEGKTLSLASESGFSLDRTYDFEGLSKFFAEEVEPLLQEFRAATPGVITQQEIAQVKTALAAKHPDPDPFFRLLGKISEAGDPELADVIHSKTRSDYAFQHARYDGQLKGTEVGMVLFYTDLMAKLWVLDFMNSTPSDTIRGFYPLSDTPVSLVHQANVEKFSRTRLWFGPRNQGFQLAGENGNKMFFGRTATRVYSASSDPFAPGEEQQGNAASTEFLGWWDGHYDEIARHEPQYERLNEIMKWSVVVGWLSNSDRLSSMNFLKVVPVKDTNRFPEWADQTPDLRFKDWKKIGFYPPGYKKSLTEALPLLKSPSEDLIGGVSLGGREVFRGRKPLTPNEKIDARALRSNVDYSASTAGPAGESIKSIDGSSYGLRNGPGPVAELIAKAKEKTYLRDSASELNQGLSFKRKLTKNAQNLKVETSAGQVPIGELRITRRQNGFEVGTESRALEAGHSFGRDLSLVDDPDVLIKSHPDVQTAYKVSAAEYVVKLRGQNKWHRFSFDDGAQPLPVGWDSRIAEIGGERVVNIKAIDSAGPQATPQRLLRSDRLPVAGEPIPQAEYARLDALIADSPVKALRQINELSGTHGRPPELVLREALAQIRRGKTVEGERGLADFVKAAGDKYNDIIGDMNAFLTRNGLIPKGDGLFVITDADQVSLGYRVAELRTASGGSDPAKDYIYMDLTLVDQNQSTLETMQQVLANDLGESVEIPIGSIGTYRPAYIRDGGSPGGPNAGRTFKIVTKAGIPPPRIRPMIPCVSTDDDEMQDDGDFICGEDEDRDRSIYLVIPKSR